MIMPEEKTGLNKPGQLVWLLFFASLWGIGEVAAGGALYASDAPYASVFLTVWALLILSMGRGFLNKPGTSTLIGCIAALYRIVNAAPFFCHIWGIVFIGIAFDLASSLLMKEKRQIPFASSFAGVTTAYSGNVFFAVAMTWIFRSEHWIAGGMTKIFDHVFINGTLVAFAAAAAVPLGLWIGRKGDDWTRLRTRWVYGTLSLLVVGLWSLVRTL